MDWSKAKTILIVVFLITNLVLGVFVLSTNRETDPGLDPDFIQDVKDMLGEKNIGLAREIPREDQGLIPLIVEYETVDLEAINRLYFHSRGQVEEGEETSRLVQGQEELELVNERQLFYENKSQEEKYPGLDQAGAQEVAQDFLRRLGLEREAMTRSYIGAQEGGYLIVYSKKYQDRYLEKSYIELEVDQRGVRRMERIWLNVMDQGENQIFTSTAAKALLSLLSQEEVYGKTISEIDLAYYFDPEEQGYTQAGEYARKGKTVPAWRVGFTDGTRKILFDY